MSMQLALKDINSSHSVEATPDSTTSVAELHQEIAVTSPFIYMIILCCFSWYFCWKSHHVCCLLTFPFFSKCKMIYKQRSCY